MVDGSGHVYVTDFGLAKDLYGGGGLTKPGTVMGTASYMSPEQASGKNEAVGPASDVYSLGAILYELVTGRPPFKDARVMETIRQVLEDPVLPPSKIRPEVPPELERFVLKALEKDQGRRPPTASQFAKALEALSQKPSPAPASVPTPLLQAAAERPQPSPAPARPLGKIVFWAVVLLILSVLSGLGLITLLRGGAVAGH